MHSRGVAIAIEPTRRSLGVGAQAFVGLALVLAAGCADILGIDVPPLKATPGLGSEGGEGGVDGTGASGVSGAGLVDGAGLGASGPGQAGRRGAGGHGGAGATQSGGGAAGSASAGAGHAGFGSPTEGEPCELDGTLACVRPHATARLRCEAGVWAKQHSCEDGQYCDSRSGACGDAHFACGGDSNPGDRICAGGSNSDVYICGPDLVTAEVEHCVFGCRPGESDCFPPTGRELQLEQPPGVVTVDAYWPRPAEGDTRIQVCVTNSAENAATQTQWARDEVERTWGRYGGVAFTGWDTCSDDATGVTVSFVGQDEPCTNELGGIDRIGYPGQNGAVNVRLCLRYHDADGYEHNTSQALLRLVARHEFGHVLGFDDVTKGYSVPEFMAWGIDSGQLASYTFAFGHIWRLQAIYGRKPSGALVAPSGRCLTQGAGNELVFDVCDATPAQQFRFVDGQLRHEGSLTCLTAGSTGGAVSWQSCAPADTTLAPGQRWSPAGAQVLGYGGACLSRFGAVLQTEAACYDDEARRWDIDLVDGGSRLRLRAPEIQACVTALEQSSTLALQDSEEQPLTCDNCAETDPACPVTDRFEYTSAGQIATGGRCVSLPTLGDPDDPPGVGSVSVDTCSLHPGMVWSLRGSIADGTGRRLARDGNGALVVNEPSAGELSDEETFDYYLRAE